MDPFPYSLSIYRGDSYTWQFVVWDDAAKTEPADLTDVDVAADMRQGSTVTPLDCTVTANAIAVVLSASISETLLICPADWDLELTYPTGEVRTIVAGRVNVRADVTGAA